MSEDEAGLPHALTFFVTVSVRRRILAVLREFDRDRVAALCLALGVEDDACLKGESRAQSPV